MCRIFCQNSHQIGILIKRDDIHHPRIKELILVIKIQLLEISVLLHAINAFIQQDFVLFDALVGDRKCQVRTSWMLRLLQNEQLDKAYLLKLQNDLVVLRDKLNEFVMKITAVNSPDHQKIAKELQSSKKWSTMHSFLQSHGLDINVNHDLMFIGLTYLTSRNIEQLVQMLPCELSNTKIKELLFLAKRQLSLMSIEYEQELARSLCDDEVCVALQEKQHKGFCYMSSFFVGLKPLLQNFKKSEQILATKQIIFCQCGGIKQYVVRFWKGSEKNGFIVIENPSPEQVVAVVEGYQFAGTLEQLKTLLQVPIQDHVIKSNYYKACECLKPVAVNDLEDLEQIILSNGAQHAQFTNDAEIDWGGLGLENSELKKEYEYLKTLPGYSINDMSKFCINHIYVLTVQQVLDEQKKLTKELEQKK